MVPAEEQTELAEHSTDLEDESPYWHLSVSWKAIPQAHNCLMRHTFGTWKNEPGLAFFEQKFLLYYL